MSTRELWKAIFFKTYRFGKSTDRSKADETRRGQAGCNWRNEAWWGSHPEWENCISVRIALLPKALVDLTVLVQRSLSWWAFARVRENNNLVLARLNCGIEVVVQLKRTWGQKHSLHDVLGRGCRGCGMEANIKRFRTIERREGSSTKAAKAVLFIELSLPAHGSTKAIKSSKLASLLRLLQRQHNRYCEGVL